MYQEALDLERSNGEERTENKCRKDKDHDLRYGTGPPAESWSGNFIIGASGSDKQMLCASSGACEALNIAAEKSKQKR